MTEHRTRSGLNLTDADTEALSDEIESTDYDLAALKKRRRGRPRIGSAPAEVVPVRIDPELRSAIETRAKADHITASQIIRDALREFLQTA